MSAPQTLKLPRPKLTILAIRACCRYGFTLVERCYSDIDLISANRSSTVCLFTADVLIDASTCVLVRDLTVLDSVERSQTLARGVSAMADTFLQCWVITAPLQSTSSHW